jgi:hypothetical protein
MSDPKVKGTETRPVVVPRQFLNKLDHVKRRKPLLEGQIPTSVTARLRRFLSGKDQQQSARS